MSDVPLASSLTVGTPFIGATDPRSEELLKAQKQALEMVVCKAPLPEVLAYLTQVVEEQAEDRVTASILLLDPGGRLHTGAAPGLPDAYNQAIDGVEACEDVGTCCVAAATGRVVITPDIDADPKWAALKSLPLGLGLKAAWSQPIMARDGRVLGTFGTYFRQRRMPSSLERRLVETLSQTAALAIERKRADDHQQLMVNELNHRVKNTLATVQSFAAQTLRSAPDLASARRTLEDRIQSLAAAHDILSQENWGGADLGDVAQAAIAPFRARGSERISLSGGPARVSPAQALGFAMAIHELATNALKHGALSVPEGSVEISWREAKVAGRSELIFRWIEAGGPPVRPPERRGFGSRLLERGLAGEIGGRTHLEYAPGGVIFEAVAER